MIPNAYEPTEAVQQIAAQLLLLAECDQGDLDEPILPVKLHPVATDQNLAEHNQTVQ